jgi:hypothetical protein
MDRAGILKIPIFGKCHRMKYCMHWSITDNTLLSPLYFVKLFLAQVFLNFTFELCEGFFFFYDFTKKIYVVLLLKVQLLFVVVEFEYVLPTHQNEGRDHQKTKIQGEI